MKQVEQLTGVETLATELFGRVGFRTSTADKLVAEFERRRWNTRKLPFRGTITAPFNKNGFTYTDFKIQDKDTLPRWVRQRLEVATRPEYDVQQIIFGDEDEDPLAETEEMIARQTGRAFEIFKMAAVGMVIAAVLYVVISALVAIAAVAGVLLLAGAAISAMGLTVDPQIIVVTGDGQWVLVAEYLH